MRRMGARFRVPPLNRNRCRSKHLFGELRGVAVISPDDPLTPFRYERMSKPYQRRAIFLCAFAALQPGSAKLARATTPKDDPESLWEALTHATSPTALPAGIPTRRSLGPVPGFTVPSSTTGKAVQEDFFGKKRKKGMLGDFGEWVGRMQRATGTNVNLKGSMQFSYRMDNISGGADATNSYHSDQYNGNGSNGLYNLTQVDVDATIFNHVHYKTTVNNHILNNTSDPNYNRVQVDYNVANTRVQWGDINAGFTGNSLVTFNRFLHGVQWTNSWGRKLKTQLLYSQAKAEARTYTLQGAGNAGPYYVFSGQIVDGSVRVRINDRDLTLGREYTLDQYSGELRLLNGLIALPSDTIAVTYEAIAGYGGQSSGNIYGVRTDLVAFKGVNLGLTHVQQTSNGSGIPQRETRYLYGYGTPAAAYELPTQIDFSKPMEVRIAGVLLMKDSDYVTDLRFPSQVRILQAIPPSQQIQIDYYPLQTNVTPGNRSVTGLDSRIQLGKLGTLTAEAALSGLTVQGIGHGGSAWNVRADLTPLRDLRTSITLKNIGSSYSSIESPGFGRNERGMEMNADYAINSRLKLTGTFQSTKRASYSSFSGGAYSLNAAVGEDQYSQKSAGLNYQFARNGSVNLSRTLNNTDAILGQSSNNRTDTLALNYGFRNITFDASVNRNVSKYQYVLDAVGSSFSAGSSATWSRHVGVSWNPLKWLSLTTSLSDNDINSYVGNLPTHAIAKDTQFSARIVASKNLRFNVAHTLSDSGNANAGATGGYSTGLIGGGANLGLGSNGNFSGGLGGSNSSGFNGYTSFGGKSSSNRVSMEYLPRPDMTLQLSVDQSSSVGDYLYNSSRNGYSFTFGYQPSDRMRFDLNMTNSRNTLTNGFGGSNSNTMSLGVSGKPFGGKLNLTLNYQKSLSRSAFNTSGLSSTSGTTPIAGTNLTDSSTSLNSMSARMDYALGKRYSLFGEFLNSDSSGSFGSSENNLRIGLDYLLSQSREGSWKFSLGWQTYARANHEVTLSSYNYKVSTLLAEFGFNFR